MGPNKWHDAQDSVADWSVSHQELIQANPELKAVKKTRIPQGLEYQGRVVPGVYEHPERKERMGAVGWFERWLLRSFKP